MKERLINNIGLKVIAVLFASLLWLMVVNIDDPYEIREFKNVEVIVQHEEVIKNAGKTYQVLEDFKYVTVYVKANRRVLEKINADNIKAAADLRQLTMKSLVPIKVYVNGYEGKYKEAYASPSNLQISIETSQVKTFPINVTTVGTLQNGMAIGSLSAQPEKIKISGPEATINKVDRVVAKVDVSGVVKATTLPAELVYYDKDNNVIDPKMITTEPEDLSVQVAVDLLSTKQLPLEFNTAEISVAEGYLFEIAYEPENIQVSGQEETLSKLEKITVSSKALKLEEISQKTEVVVDISEYLPKDIKLVDETMNSVVVTVTVIEEGAKVIDIPVQSISIHNLDESLKISYPIQSVELTFRGSEEALAQLTAEKISASIELGAQKQEGEIEVPVQVTLTQPGITIDVSTIKVTLKKK